MIPELFLVFTGGLLGSAHCVGMCGGFALSIGASSINWRRNFARQFVYSAGRIATYTSIGAIVAYAGLQLNRAVAEAVPVQSILALLAGGLLIVQGLLAAGVVRSSVGAAQGACLMPRFLGAFLACAGIGQCIFRRRIYRILALRIGVCVSRPGLRDAEYVRRLADNAGLRSGHDADHGADRLGRRFANFPRAPAGVSDCRLVRGAGRRAIGGAGRGFP